MVKKQANKPDSANPAMALWFTIEDQWRRVADLGRSNVRRSVEVRLDLVLAAEAP
jgi:hypothetical protein